MSWASCKPHQPQRNSFGQNPLWLTECKGGLDWPKWSCAGVQTVSGGWRAPEELPIGMGTRAINSTVVGMLKREANEWHRSPWIWRVLNKAQHSTDWPVNSCYVCCRPKRVQEEAEAVFSGLRNSLSMFPCLTATVEETSRGMALLATCQSAFQGHLWGGAPTSITYLGRTSCYR